MKSNRFPQLFNRIRRVTVNPPVAGFIRAASGCYQLSRIIKLRHHTIERNGGGTTVCGESWRRGITGRWGDGVTGRRGGGVTGGRGDGETGRLGDSRLHLFWFCLCRRLPLLNLSQRLSVSPSPCLPIPASPLSLRVPVSPRLRVPASPRLPVPTSPFLLISVSPRLLLLNFRFRQDRAHFKD